MVSREAVLAKAASWVGMLEDPDGSNNIWFSRDWGIVGQSWCFAFVQSCFYYAGAPLPHQSMYCPYGVQWARDNGQSIEPDYGGSPLPGDIVFFTWGNGYGRWTPGTGDHVGIVEAWDGGDTLWTIEGNIGSPQGVYRKVRSISGTVVCFWRPTVFDDSLGTAEVPTTPPTAEDDVTPEEHQLVVDTAARALYVQQLAQNLTNTVAELKNLAADSNTAVHWLLNDTKTSSGLQVGPAVEKLAAQVTDLGNNVSAVGNAVKGIPDSVAANAERLLQAVKAIPSSGGGSGPVDVKAVLLNATTDEVAQTLGVGRLIEALGVAFAAQQGPKPPVPAPNDPA